MKTNILKQTGLLLCIVVALLTTSCNKNESNSNQIVGNWVCISCNGNNVENDRSIAFREDKVYTDRTGILLGGVSNSYDCKWSIVDNCLYIDYTYMDGVYDSNGGHERREFHKTREFEIIDLTHTSLKLQGKSYYNVIWEFNKK